MHTHKKRILGGLGSSTLDARTHFSIQDRIGLFAHYDVISPLPRPSSRVGVGLGGDDKCKLQLEASAGDVHAKTYHG